MTDFRTALPLALTCVVAILASPGTVDSQEPWRVVMPEQRRLEIRDPSQLPRARFPDLPAPRTVAAPGSDAEPQRLSLDDAIRTALETTQVVRVLAGVTAVSSGRTIYDPAISNTQIDDARVNPPTRTRAYFRGRCVSEFSDALVAANWHSLVFDIS